MNHGRLFLVDLISLDPPLPPMMEQVKIVLRDVLEMEFRD